MVEERDRLGRHLMLKGYFEEEVDTIKADTYVKEGDDEEARVVGVVDGLDGAFRQTVLDNQGDDAELPEGGSEKALREMSLRVKDLESGLAREREASKALLSAIEMHGKNLMLLIHNNTSKVCTLKVERRFMKCSSENDLQTFSLKVFVELDSSRSREDNVLMCNREFVEQFDKMNEANENTKDQYIKAYLRLVKLTQIVSDLTFQVKEKDYEIKKGLKELSETCPLRIWNSGKCKEGTMTLMRESHDLNLNRRKPLRVAREHSGGSRTKVKAHLVRGDVVSLSGRIRELESDVSCIQGHVQKGNANLRECQHKLDVALIREKVLEGEIIAKESLVKNKEELLKDLSAREELNAELGRFRARVVDLQAMNLAESAKYIAKLEEDVIYYNKVDADIIEQKNKHARLKSRLKRLQARFVTMVVPDASRSDLLRVIVAYFIEKVKRLESE
ncbi:hypothetical protein GIB67_031020 [Kingdonia uniflora]|uniref:Uncharacterized protein n=1 Tax=Kingdonia uniflora TaxID=39325 RepID=A0A7J7NGC4_9MAGN|nr:hypothetical protein GIB67_031020 [Kingdonia uniflora]